MAKNKKKSKPSARGKVKSQGKPQASSTKAPGKVKAKVKVKRVAVEPARRPVPSAGGWPNPILVSNRNKRALCITFASLLGGAKGTEDQDKLLVKAVRESGILWKAGMSIDNYDDDEANSHLKQAEQSGKSYANRCGRGRHDDYQAKFPEKIADCVPFAEAFIKIMELDGEKYETARQNELDHMPELKVKIAEAQATKNKSKSAKPTAASKKKVTPKAKKPAAQVVKKAPAKAKKAAVKKTA